MDLNMLNSCGDNSVNETSVKRVRYNIRRMPLGDMGRQNPYITAVIAQEGSLLCGGCPETNGRGFTGVRLGIR